MLDSFAPGLSYERKKIGEQKAGKMLKYFYYKDLQNPEAIDIAEK
jgi:hypothetical protein